jgi:hypothetical protein
LAGQYPAGEVKLQVATLNERRHWIFAGWFVAVSSHKFQGSSDRLRRLFREYQKTSVACAAALRQTSFSRGAHDDE